MRVQAEPPAAEDDAATELSGWADSISGEVTHLSECLDAIDEALESTEANAPAQLDAKVRKVLPYVERNAVEIRKSLDVGREVLVANAKLHLKYGRTWTALGNAWEHAVGNWPRPAGAAAVEVHAVRGSSVEVRRHLNRMFVESGRVVIPSRLRRWAAAKRIGDKLDFHARFEHELPEKAGRQEILDWLAEAPTGAPGIIDAKTGFLTVASLKPWRRAISYAIFIGVAALLTAAAAAGPAVAGQVGAGGTALDARSPINAMWLFLATLLGGAAHLGVDAIKEARSATVGPRALEDMALWGHVHERQIVWAMVMLWVAWLVYSLIDPNPTPYFAFVLGYSVDSFIDIFLGRFTGDMKKATALLEERYKPADTKK